MTKISRIHVWHSSSGNTTVEIYRGGTVKRFHLITPRSPTLEILATIVEGMVRGGKARVLPWLSGLVGWTASIGN